MVRLQIAQDVEAICLVTDQRTLVNRAIQHALERVYQFHDFPYYLQDKGVISTVETYETGTVEVTNNSTAITFTGSTLTAGMAGRKIRFNGENPYYRILSVNTGAGTAVLENAFQGTSDTDATFVIYKDEYRLASDVDKYKIMRQLHNGVVLFDTTPTNFDSSFPMPNSYSDPFKSIMVGTKLDTYTTGTVSATVNATTITGVDTAWTSVEGLGRMTNLRIGNNVYTVKSVDSATQITTYEAIATTVSGATYEITLNNLVVQLFNIPDTARHLYYRYFRIPAFLANDYDIPDMPHEWHWLLMYGALSIMFLHKGDVGKSQQEAEARFIDGLNMMKLKIGSFSPDRIYHRKSIDRTRGGISEGIEEAGFDRRWSMPR